MRLLLVLGPSLLSGCAPQAMSRVGLLPQPTRSLSLLVEGDHQRIPFQLIGNYAFLDGEVKGRSGGFILDTGTPQAVFLNDAYLPLRRDHFVAKGKAGGAQGNAGREQIVYAHTDVGSIRIGQQVFADMGTVFSSDFSYISDMANGGLRPDFLGFVGLPMLIEHEFVLDYKAATLDLYRLDTQGKAKIQHVGAGQVVVTLAFHGQPGEGGHLPFVELSIGGIPFVGLLDNGTLGDLALTEEAEQQLASKGLLQKTDHGWHIDGASYRGVHLILDTPMIRRSEQNTIRLGHNLLQHYRSVWNYRLQTVVLLESSPSQEKIAEER